MSAIFSPTVEAMNSHLDKWSEAGWELVSVTQCDRSESSNIQLKSYFNLFWKRPTPPKST